MAATGTNEKNGNNLICIPGSLLHHLRPKNQIVHEPPTNNISNQTKRAGIIRVVMGKNMFLKGVLHLWALFLNTLLIFSKNKETLDKVFYGSGRKFSK